MNWPQSIGSSPPARGRALDARNNALSQRVIPACAGKGRGCSRCRTHAPGHPRLRGEGHGAVHTPMFGCGSSPPARGRVIVMLCHVRVDRVIPACAGKGHRRHPVRRPGRGHPRLRGEGYNGAEDPLDGRGSSPPARGRAEALQRRRRLARVIPACAGKGPGSDQGSPRWPGHPRLRGEGGTPAAPG